MHRDGHSLSLFKEREECVRNAQCSSLLYFKEKGGDEFLRRFYKTPRILISPVLSWFIIFMNVCAKNV